MKILYSRSDVSAVVNVDDAAGRVDEVIELIESKLETNYGACVRPETPQESRALMAEFCLQWANQGAVSPVLLEWVAACFDAMVDTKQGSMTWPARVLGLALPPQRPAENRARDIEITRRVAALIDEGKQPTTAYQEIADEMELDESVVGRIYRRNRGVPF